MEIREIIDKNVWEKFINENSPQSLFQSWDWGEVIKKAQSSKLKAQSLWRIGIYDRDKLVGIAQVSKVIAKKGPFLHIRHGPIFSSWKKDFLEFLIDYLKKLNKTEKTVFLRISPLLENNDQNRKIFAQYGFIDAPIHAMDGEYCWVLDLKKSEEEILVAMRKTTRYLIKQAQKLHVEIVKSKDKEDIEDFLSLYRQTAKRHNFVEHRGITEEFEQFLKGDQILLFRGYYQKRLISAALIVFYKTQAIYHHSASIEQKIPVNYLLQWEVIKEAKRRRINFYNLWGIAPLGKTRHPWKGLTTFKQGFGGETIEYLHAQDFPLSVLYCTTYIMETCRRIWKGY